MLNYDFSRRSHSPSNGIIVNVVVPDRDLNFQTQTFETLSSRKRWELALKKIHITFTDVYIRRWMAALPTTLTYIFEVKILNDNILEVVKARTQTCNVFLHIDPWHRITPLRIIKLTFIFKSNICVFSSICNTNCTTTAIGPGRFVSRLTRDPPP